MPEVVNNYIADENIAALFKIYNRLWQAYKDDVEKYAKNETERRIIRHVINSAPSESDRISFEGFANSNYRSREVGEALRSLHLAKIIRLIYSTTSIEPPIAIEYKKRPRLQFLDTGMLNHILLLQEEMIGLKDLSDLYRGRIIEHLVYQELISIHEDISYQPHFWVRESKNSNSKVDLVYLHSKFLIPIEVKSGKLGRLKSLHQFVEHCKHPYAIRLYAGEYKIEETITPGGVPYLLMNLPYYLASQIPEYIQYLVSTHPLKSG
jgi:hypothetical protein